MRSYAPLSICAWVLVVGLVSPCPSRAQVVVLIHPDTGKYISVVNKKNPKTAAMKQANLAVAGGGWKVVLASDALGYGTMFCVRVNEMTQFFIAHGKASGTEAITEARAQASAAARGSNQTPYWCGAWNNRNLFPLDPPSGPMKPEGPRKATVTGVRG